MTGIETVPGLWRLEYKLANQLQCKTEDGCIVWNAHNTLFGWKRSAISVRRFIGPTRVFDANGISIASAAFAGLTRWQTNRLRPSMVTVRTLLFNVCVRVGLCVRTITFEWNDLWVCRSRTQVKVLGHGSTKVHVFVWKWKITRENQFRQSSRKADFNRKLKLTEINTLP